MNLWHLMMMFTNIGLVPVTFAFQFTTLIEKYGPEFDSEFWSNAKALEAIIGDEEFGKIKADL